MSGSGQVRNLAMVIFLKIGWAKQKMACIQNWADG
jgi:hypothetical protein